MGSPLSLESFASGAERAKGAEDGEGEIEAPEEGEVEPFGGGASEGGEAESAQIEKFAKAGEEPEVGDEEPEVGEEAGGGGGGATEELLLTLLNNSFGLNVDVNKGGAAGSVTGFLFVGGGDEGTSSFIGGCAFDFCVDLYTA